MRLFIHALLFGDYPEMHRRLLDSFKRCIPASPDIDVRLWCNTVGKASSELVTKSGYSASISPGNLPKYKLMRLLFDLPKKSGGDKDWVVWFDDDSHLTQVDWLKRHEEFIAAHPEAVYMGQKWFGHHLSGQAEFIRAADWYKGKPFELFPTRQPGKKAPGVSFAQGAAWWLRLDVLRLLDWPDQRLNHNGGDTLLGEAVRQQGLPFHCFHYGVKINDAKRRGHSERPAGSTVDTRR